MSADPKSRKEALYVALKASVLTLELPPGSDLDETALSEEFSLSRTPLREVFRNLAGEGYLDLRENRGARISEMSHKTLRDFFLAAPMIYGAVMRLAAINHKTEQIGELMAAQERFRAALRKGSGAERALANTRFHEVTGEMAGNIYLTPSFQRLLIDHARISMTFYQPQNGDMARNVGEAADQHDAIIAAIQARDDERCAQLAIDHWNLSRGRIELFVMPAGLDMPLGELPATQTA
ncbi:GntR family transcriptional regulator [Shimia haliotis]|uniref:DNA-binding transcriptional regulator, GntR family n=1 Tax=Shimia haliotis TaxID=1280847 RepID=A0A1I4EC44_9RHOB|nr:GntR family transcriptional regulator [Shimia haliotis]SFL01956.1 DNA-binding transcriptional regulator, GntR family [Shimia haliotis]